ncbi:MAG: ATP-binding protein [Pseudodesulfovibrio sp.]|uniref:ATP-binding protein n=1 Tax=Pseudodesulfovibrio sp. TaxID=2035812 RepID=UPI003D103640
MKSTKRHMKKYALTLAIAAVSILHFSGIQGPFSYHGLHRELFFIPILLASYWFGLKSGVLTSVLVSVLFLAGMEADSVHSMPLSVMLAQVAVYLLAASLLGWLSDRQRSKTQELLEAERLSTLGHTVGVLSWEIGDNLNAMRRLFERAGGLNASDLNEDFTGELDVMKNMVKSMTRYAAKDTLRITTVDLNEAVGEMAQKYRPMFREKDLTLAVSEDESGCPSKVDPAAISWVLAKLLDNAMDASGPGDNVVISTCRHGDHCEVRVDDQGAGVSEENVCKLFTPFYSTKDGGGGLSLAACKKAMRDVGGDITAKSEQGSGSSFSIIVPRCA